MGAIRTPPAVESRCSSVVMSWLDSGRTSLPTSPQPGQKGGYHENSPRSRPVWFARCRFRDRTSRRVEPRMLVPISQRRRNCKDLGGAVEDGFEEGSFAISEDGANYIKGIFEHGFRGSSRSNAVAAPEFHRIGGNNGSHAQGPPGRLYGTKARGHR